VLPGDNDGQIGRRPFLWLSFRRHPGTGLLDCRAL